MPCPGALYVARMLMSTVCVPAFSASRLQSAEPRALATRKVVPSAP